MSAARMKLPVLVVTMIGAGLALLSWSQTWYELRLADAAEQGHGDEDMAAAYFASFEEKKAEGEEKEA